MSPSRLEQAYGELEKQDRKKTGTRRPIDINNQFEGRWVGGILGLVTSFLVIGIMALFSGETAFGAVFLLLGIIGIERSVKHLNKPVDWGSNPYLAQEMEESFRKSLRAAPLCVLGMVVVLFVIAFFSTTGDMATRFGESALVAAGGMVFFAVFVLALYAIVSIQFRGTTGPRSK